MGWEAIAISCSYVTFRACLVLPGQQLHPQPDLPEICLLVPTTCSSLSLAGCTLEPASWPRRSVMISCRVLAVCCRFLLVLSRLSSSSLEPSQHDLLELELMLKPRPRTQPDSSLYSLRLSCAWLFLLLSFTAFALGLFPYVSWSKRRDLIRENRSTAIMITSSAG